MTFKFDEKNRFYKIENQAKLFMNIKTTKFANLLNNKEAFYATQKPTKLIDELKILNRQFFTFKFARC